MPNIQVSMEGLDKVQAKLGEIAALQWLRGLMTAAASDVKSWVAQYPDSTAANSPGNASGKWYERNYGPRWSRKDGSVGGRRTSETLGKRWAIDVASDGKQAKIGNNATYGPFVQDEDKQAWFHKARNWRTVQGAAKEKGPGIVQKIRDAIAAKWRE